MVSVSDIKLENFSEVAIIGVVINDQERWEN